MDLAASLREARRRTSLNLVDVARSLNVTHATVSRWETGASPLPDLRKLQTWAALLGCRLEVGLTTDERDPVKELASLLSREEIDLLIATLRIVKRQGKLIMQPSGSQA